MEGERRLGGGVFVFYSQVIHKGGSFSPPCGRRVIFPENSDKIFPISWGIYFRREHDFCIDGPASLEKCRFATQMTYYADVAIFFALASICAWGVRKQTATAYVTTVPKAMRHGNSMIGIHVGGL